MRPAFECALNPATAGERLPVAEYIALAGRHGYRWVEFDSRQILALSEMPDGAAADALAGAAVRAASSFLPVAWRADEAAFDRGMERLPSVARTLSELGAERCCTWLPPNLTWPAQEARQVVGRRFRRIAALLDGHGLRFGLEFLGPQHFLSDPGFTILHRMQDMLAFAEEIGTNAGILVDSLHWHCQGGDVAALAAVPRGRLVYAHIDDAPPNPRAEQRDDDRLPPGEGAIDLCGFLGALAAAGYDGPVGIEIDGPALEPYSPDEAARRAKAAWDRTIARCSQY